MTRMGLHLHSTATAQAVMNYVRQVQPPIMKAIDPDDALIADCRALSPKTRWIGRVVADQNLNDYGAFQGRVLSAARAHPEVWGWEGMNEVAVRAKDLRAFTQAEVGLAKRLNEMGRAACIGGFSTGFVEGDDFSYMRTGWEYLQAHPDIAVLHFHEYSAPYVQYAWQTPDGKNQYPPGGSWTGMSLDRAQFMTPGIEGWLTLRYRKLRKRLVDAGFDRVRFVITESGIDGGVTQRPGPGGGGWADFQQPEWTGGAAGNYAKQLYWYWWQISQDPYVIGGVDFGNGTLDPHWLTWDLTRQPSMLEQVIGVMRTLPGEVVAPPPVTTIDIAKVRATATSEQWARGIHLNASAALLRSMLQDGMSPLTNEYAYSDASGDYTAQLAGEPVPLVAGEIHLIPSRVYLWHQSSGKVIKVGM